MSSTLVDNCHVPVMKDLHINDSAKPEFISHRMKIFDRLFNKQQEEINAKERKPIQIKVPSGKIFDGIAYETTPADIAKEIKKSWQDTFVVAKVQDELWDLRRPLEESCSLELLDFENPEGQKVFWHSSAHILGEACENELCAKLCVGPPTSEGFFYEMHLDGKAILSTDLPRIEEAAKKICQEKQEFERLTISKADLLEMFKHNPFKLQIIQSKIPDGSFTTVYRCGSLIDLCRGPHVLNSGKVKAFSILKHSSSYFLGDSKNETLQRVYGISFPNTKQMSEYKKFLEEAAKRDHRKIGRDQELFFFHELSPGSCFFLPHGARIYNKLMELMKTEYHTRGYSEVVTPNIYNSKLWKTSGHWQNYAENMFQIAIEKDEFALKPMNCPGHCLMFKLRDRSWRELPWRLADFGVLHRNEFSGALTGLTRVRRFCQDDAHIFCTMEQLNDEILQCFDFLEAIYKRFGFEFHLELSTRPDKYLGAIETWNLAEAELTKALQSKFGDNWKINAGDGAFYGPKVDITIKDALRRKYQCATIQLDFQLPERFELEYTAPDGQKKRPVMIHRAILGSLERVIAILTEHFAGKWPLWLSPRQVMIVPVAAVYYDYAKSLQSLIHQAGFYVEADLSEDTMQKKVRNAQTKQFNYTCIVGQEELDAQGLNVRKRGQDPKQPNSRELIHVDAFIARLKEECLQFK